MAWVKIDKGILESYCFANPVSFKIWVWLLVKANYKKTFASLKIGRGYTTIEVDRGQLLFGRNRAELELNINGSTICRHLDKMQELGQINIQPNNQYSVITICKYNDYQSKDNEDEQPTNNQRTTNEQSTNNKRTTDEHQVNTSKEVLEYIEYKEEPILLLSATAPLPKKNLEERVLLFGKSLEDYKSEYQREMLVEFFNYWREPNHSKTKMKWEFEKTWDLNLRLKNWYRRVLQKKPNNEGIKFDWEVEKNNFLKDETWAIKITSEHKIKKEDFERSIQDFIKNLELQDDYKNIPALKKHYLNHFNKHGLFVNKQLAEIKTMQTPTYGKQETLEEKLARYK